jgi:hypothetical protein
MSKGNATYLFREPSEHHHHSESFWTSFVAISLLLASRAPEGIRLPTFQYMRRAKEWSFEPCETLDITKPLEWFQVVVEGKIRAGILPNLKELPPQDLWDLKPDILIWQDQHVTLIEVKTVGHHLGEYQKVCCQNVASYLRRNGYTVDLLFLISAGHESRHDWDLLRTISLEAREFRLLLWEKVLQTLTRNQSTKALVELIPDLTQYITPEDGYMRGAEPSKTLEPTA